MLRRFLTPELLIFIFPLLSLLSLWMYLSPAKLLPDPEELTEITGTIYQLEKKSTRSGWRTSRVKIYLEDATITHPLTYNRRSGALEEVITELRTLKEPVIFLVETRGLEAPDIYGIDVYGIRTDDKNLRTYTQVKADEIKSSQTEGFRGLIFFSFLSVGMVFVVQQRRRKKSLRT